MPIQTIRCQDKTDAILKATDLLKQLVDRQTLLLLSGGSTPTSLYQQIATEAQLKPGAVAMVDERFGPRMHPDSNEKMISTTGLIDYLTQANIPFQPILEGADPQKTAEDYQQKISQLFQKFPKTVAIMGIGADGHTAGLLPNLDYDHSQLVIAYPSADQYQMRITLTFEALFKIKSCLVLAFGENKKPALQQLFTSSNLKSTPAAFFNQTSAKVYLLTDVDSQTR